MKGHAQSSCVSNVRTTFNIAVLSAAFTFICFTQVLAAGFLQLEASYTSNIENSWVKVERWRDTASDFTQETFPSDGRGDQSGQRKIFFGGDESPHSSRFLMYYAPGWDSNPKATPVLLVHGANQDADLAWADPNEAGGFGCGRASCPSTGLMQALSNDGFKVFAVNFPHKNGDGYFWAEQIADAIEVVKNQTGASKVDIVSWSKGAFNARMYASSVKQSWGTSFRTDIGKLIMLGGPNNGIDLSFRHGWTFSLTIFPECGGVINGPAPHDWLICFGFWRFHPEWTYGSSFFPGAAQMLKRWDSTYSLPSLEQDWWTTYHGGWGVFTHSPGIDAYLGQSIVNTIRNAGAPASVRVHNLCGNQNDIALLHNEHTGPSDGVLFIDSCSDTTGVANNGGGATIAVNHLELGWTTEAINQITSWLNAP